MQIPCYNEAETLEIKIILGEKRQVTNMQVTKYVFQPHGDERGQLVALEELINVPFQIKRVYYMYDTIKDMHRGRHAHKNLQQILVCVHGSCKVLLDDGTDREIVSLDKPYEGIYISGSTWRELYDFSNDAVIMVLASELYNEGDYIRDYREFKKWVSDLRKENAENEADHTDSML